MINVENPITSQFNEYLTNNGYSWQCETANLGYVNCVFNITRYIFITTKDGAKYTIETGLKSDDNDIDYLFSTMVNLLKQAPAII